MQIQRGCRRWFSIISNVRNPAELHYGRLTYTYDEHLERYPRMAQAYLARRRVTKKEVPPKILALAHPAPELAHELGLQRLSVELETETLLKVPLTTLSSSYFIGRFAEKHLKALLDEYAGKVLLCGRTPRLDRMAQYRELRARAVEWYRVFFFGEEPTELEREIEAKYLTEKQQKFMRFTRHRDNGLYKCKWTDSNQRCLEQYKNWQVRPLNEYPDFRPLFRPLDTAQKLEAQKALLELDGAGALERLRFWALTQAEYAAGSKANLKWVLQVNLVRLVHWCNSMEFLRVMRVPPDFQIELAVFHFHAWLLRDRLRQEDSFTSQYLVQLIDFTLRNYTMEKVGVLSIKKKNEFLKNVSQMMKLNLNVLSYHFGEAGPSDKYQRIDALVWSTVFLEKVERYSDEVYMFSEYAVRMHQFVRELPLRHLMQGMVEFDAAVGDYDFVSKIQRVNPPLSREEFEREFASDSKDKRYYYSHGLPNVVMPMQDDRANVKPRQIRKSTFVFRLLRLLRKYQTLENYDYYNEVDRQSQDRQHQKKTGWASEDHRLFAIGREFQAVQNIKRGIKK